MASLERVGTKKRATHPDEPWRYWRTRSIEERIAAVVELRRGHRGWEHGTEPQRLGVDRPGQRLAGPQRIDILTFATGLSFVEAYAAGVTIEIGGAPVPFVSIDDLRTNKLATGRLRDRAAVAELAPIDGEDR